MKVAVVAGQLLQQLAVEYSWQHRLHVAVSRAVAGDLDEGTTGANGSVSPSTPSALEVGFGIFTSFKICIS